MKPVYFFLCYILLFIFKSQAKPPISYCKCTCDRNSTIIELTRFALSNLPHASKPIDGSTLAKNPCMNCTKALCNIAEPDLCNGAAVGDEIVPLCFQRDSLQDKIVVEGFLLVVSGLLLYSIFKNKISEIYQNIKIRYGYQRVHAN
ncbi:hypothetical protein BB559_006754 [Furculomyces boomerangus]|uniref:Uncharacterized protein n=2 Tax=Harpellales TaxID=61421 RepID=A0A2T9Y0I9_9FUNG|nr:hypothetical protein BB559_006796 [Furculomyces boomerangus]PVU85950.1 hypothetical protein BB559_006754 [Furculomyces boomerangus]PWA03177.1 hypothetical protein BB558_000662 [Smittium angustum]